MDLIKAAFIGISMYSALPMPQFNWEERPLKFAIAFFPWVGIITGGLFYLWFNLAEYYSLPAFVRACVGAAIPLMVTGGIHLDGFMDTTDALRSYQSRERRLEILKDPHIGAFAVIGVIIYGLVYLPALSLIGLKGAAVLSMGFFLSRTFSGMSVVTFQNAAGEGTLYTFSAGREGSSVKLMLLIQMCACAALMIITGGLSGVLCVCAAIAVFIYYRWRSYEVFGGITGDLAGWFLCLCELAMALALSAEAVL